LIVSGIETSFVVSGIETSFVNTTDTPPPWRYYQVI
jgi:hypothetical protein